MKKVIYSWSGGKDSAMALHELQKNGAYEVMTLFTVVTKDYGRISMHGVREELLNMQALSLDLPLEKIYITSGSGNKEYEENLRKVLTRYKDLGAQAVAFGDIFLEDLKRYREERLREIGMEAIFPIWKRGSIELAHTFIDAGFKAMITCVDSNMLDGRFCGRAYDERFLSELPAGVDPCGENGEFHSFVYDGPIFRESIPCAIGETVLRDKRYYYTDILTSTCS